MYTHIHTNSGELAIRKLAPAWAGKAVLNDAIVDLSSGKNAQFVAECCSVLQRVAACCRVLQRVAVCCSVL